MCAKDEFVDLHLQIETSRLWLEKGQKMRTPRRAICTNWNNYLYQDKKRTRKKGWERCKCIDIKYMCKYVYSQIWSFLTGERLRIVTKQEDEEEEDEGGAEQRRCANKAWIPRIWDFHSFDFRFEINRVITCDWSTPFWKWVNDHSTSLRHISDSSNYTGIWIFS